MTAEPNPAAARTPPPVQPRVQVRFNAVSEDFGPIRAVDRVGLTARKGRFVLILGPSGCGKTPSDG